MAIIQLSVLQIDECNSKESKATPIILFHFIIITIFCKCYYCSDWKYRILRLTHHSEVEVRQVLYKSGNRNLEGAQITFLQQLKGVTKLDHELNTDVAKYSEKQKTAEIMQRYRLSNLTFCCKPTGKGVRSHV